MARGGYQRPSNPAPASGPGPYARRTDGKQAIRDIPNAAYGEQQTFRGIEGAAPMAQAGPVAAPSGPAQPPVDLSQVVPLGAGSQRPGEPVTAGAATGPGPGPEAMGLTPDQDAGRQYLRQIVPMLELASQLPSAGQAFRQMVRVLRGNL